MTESDKELLREIFNAIDAHRDCDNFDNLCKKIEAELAKPEPSGMTAQDIRDDDALRFIQRVLESDAPDTDRKEARDKIVEIRTRVRGVAQPEAEPVESALIEKNGGYDLQVQVDSLVDDILAADRLLSAGDSAAAIAAIRAAAVRTSPSYLRCISRIPANKE
jgi:hypothetical protein